MASVALQVTGVLLSFQSGEISSAQVNYQMTGAAGNNSAGTFIWTLTAAEQANTAGFVTSLTNKLAALTGLGVTTT